VPATCPYPVPSRSSLYPQILPEDPSQYYPTTYAWVSQVVSFPQVYLPKPCIRLFPICTTWPGHLILLDFITQTILGKEYWSLSSSLYRFLHSPLTSSRLGPNILLNTISLRSSFSVSDQVSHPYATTGKIILLYILIFQFFDSKLYDNKILHRMIASIPWLQSALNFFLDRILICYGCFQIF
jgi:hypothetical protein